jgi:hypothetical protein
MKKFYQKYIRQINDAFHYIIGFSAMYNIGFLTKFYTYTIAGKLIGVTAVSFLGGLFFGFIWEGLRSKVFDKKDVLRTAIGFTIGGLSSAWIAPNQTIAISMTILSALILVFTFTRKQ